MSKSAMVRELLAKGVSTADIQKQVGCSANLVYVLRSNASRKKAGRKASGRGPGRPALAWAAAPAGGGLSQGLLDSVRQVDAERRRLRALLEQLHALVGRALAD